MCECLYNIMLTQLDVLNVDLSLSGWFTNILSLVSVVILCSCWFYQLILNCFLLQNSSASENDL